ncbi:Carbon monoxide dehydrogenase subunit G [Actinacidiphila alni]|uniref:Carbon monoxide dehydrogenase subunit G n=1 Tax=Actinacidiphila alni TaxID=380248 RepID=A0A1I2KWT6_9ACTN|nr:SRPBCC domain-containing protein [Actinacidiphila alni]SFF71033.1 Carbon monoxide dehydrogenase subunit G [Actinacidiphila alni]
MEHEVFVPVSPARIGHALRDPALVTASLPGWQPDSGSGSGSDAASDDGAGAAGRLRLRVGGSTITYRGTVRVSGTASPFAAEASGTEVRGTGAVKATLEIAVAEATRPEPGALLTFRGAAQAEGRLASYEPDVVESAVRRLLDRFAAELAERAPGEAADADGDPDGGPVDAAGATVTGEAALDPRAGVAAVAAGEDAQDGPGAPDGAEAAEDVDLADEPLPAEEADLVDLADLPDGGTPDTDTDTARVSDLDLTPDEREPEPEADVVDDLGEPVPSAEMDDFDLVEVEVEVPESAAALDDLVPPAEAAHARRTMIGRSAEEVDHAPPRGRYAPVPAPDSASAAATLRWAAPAAAALVASAVVVGRVLRRRR